MMSASHTHGFQLPSGFHFPDPSEHDILESFRHPLRDFPGDNQALATSPVTTLCGGIAKSRCGREERCGRSQIKTAAAAVQGLFQPFAPPRNPRRTPILGPYVPICPPQSVTLWWPAALVVLVLSKAIFGAAKTRFLSIW